MRIYSDNKQILKEQAEFEEKKSKEIEEWFSQHKNSSIEKIEEFLFRKTIEENYFYDQMLIKQFIYNDVKSEDTIFDRIFNEINNRLNHFIDNTVFRVSDGDHIDMHFKYKKRIEKIKQQYQTNVNKEKEKQYRLLSELIKRRSAIQEKHRYSIKANRSLGEHEFGLYERYRAIQKKEDDLKFILINKIKNNYYNNIEKLRAQCSKNLRKIRTEEIEEENFLIKRN